MEDGEAWVVSNFSMYASPADGANETLPSVVQDTQAPVVNVTEYLPYHLRPETYLVPLVFAGIFVTGVVGNGALIFMFLKHPTLR
ncbi:Neuropeptide CCHamide-1 receptor [Portunus trituberculatus]|uniref:Neuropeptide CCHamide-1 receptor n=1 Tax=Portunus trituberculatus TaxID=210409 RepID=A0A5B7K6A0_PORTR|nr:Neuropeptide CCHamide-1 receptor [Portunus trituberculatus]